MELYYLMLTGSLSGLISILAHSVVGSGLNLVRGSPQDPSGTWSTVAISEALLHMLCGVGLGVLFWLSWGLAAIVDIAWWMRGLVFAGLCWIALIAPTRTRSGARTSTRVARRAAHRRALGHDLRRCRSCMCVELARPSVRPARAGG